MGEAYKRFSEDVHIQTLRLIHLSFSGEDICLFYVIAGFLDSVVIPV